MLWWHTYPLGFVGAPIRERPSDGAFEAPRLERVEAWLDHLIGLGLNGLQLGPVFASSTHGYDTIDHFRVDPRLGDEADLVRLITQAKKRGIRVLLDGVFHHVGRAHPLFRRVEDDGPQASSAGMFRVTWDGWMPGAPIPADVFEGHEDLVALDHTSPLVEDLVVDVMTYWLRRGIDGWRLDAAYAVPPAFWARVLPRVRSQFPEAWFSGEVIHGDQPVVVAESTMNSVTQYELWQGIWHSIADRNFYELTHALGRHNRMLRTFVPSTFVGNHDVSRIATAVGREHAEHALATLLVVGGTPAVYAGDEYGYLGLKEERLGGDDAVRPAFPRTPPSETILDAAARRMLAVTRELIAIRRRHPWLHRAVCDVVEVTNTTLALRSAIADESIILALSVGDEPAAVPAADAGTLLAGTARLEDSRVHLEPHGWAVFAGR